ncbi:MAG TPA: NEW3 domain-containing protein, partial [Candidatus Nanoarchaeia archaeon]|nr:NEW3 domain-containing protein [Candidatus Nanoarchaeia archaeon]
NGKSVLCTSTKAGLSDGTYSFKVFSNDSANNFGYTELRTAKVDSTPPVITYVNPTPADLSNQSSNTVTINVTSIDALLPVSNCTLEWSGVNESMTLNGTGRSVYCLSTKTSLADATFRFKVFSNDTLNNMAVTAARNVTIDANAPNMTYIAPTPANNTNQTADSFTINVSAIDSSLPVSICSLEFSGVNETMTINGTGKSVYCSTLKSSLSDGVYTFKVFANDTVGNTNVTATRTVRKDATPPVITYVNPTPADLSNQSSNTVTINVTAVDALLPVANCTLEWSGVNETMSINGTGKSVYCTSTKSSLGDTTYRFKVFSNDTLNNMAVTAARNVTIDANAPNMTFVDPTPLNRTNQSSTTITVNVTAIDASLPLSVCNLEFDGVNETMTMNGTGKSVYCATAKTSLADGNHTFKVYANDTVGNSNFTGTRRVLVDSTGPTITFVSPTDANGTIIARTHTFVNVTLTDMLPIDVCVLEFNGTNQSMTKVGSGSSVSCFTNKTGLGDGTYPYKVIGNDSVGNTGVSETRVVTILTSAPTVNFVNPTDADNSIVARSFTFVNVTAVSSGADFIHTCTLNFNGSMANMSKSAEGTSISCSYNFTGIPEGTFNYNVTANDTLGKTGYSNNRAITIDTKGPSLAFVLPTPENGANQSDTSATANASVDDANTNVQVCRLQWNGTNETMTKVGSGLSVFCDVAKTSLTDGLYTYKAFANDSAGNTNASATRTLSIDTSIPNFISLTTSPNTDDALDPSVIIMVSANVTDNTTAINTVILQYKLNTSANYTNSSMNLVAETGLFNTTFNASTAGGYNLRLFANDSAGNFGYSNQVNISVIYERTWSRSPADFGGIGFTAAQNKSIGLITINNTGDFGLNFTMGSDFTNTSFNQTFPMSISAGGIRAVNVSAIAPGFNSQTLVAITINASPDAVPSSLNTTATIIVADDAFLSATFLSSPSSVNQGDTGVAFSARLRNVGQSNATNVSFFYVLPTGWNVTAGTQNITVGDLAPDETATNNIEISIPGDASGSQTVVANSSGYNQSGTSLLSLGKILGASVNVDVNSPEELGQAGGGAGAAAPSGGPSGGGGGGVTTGGEVAKVPGAETIFTTQSVEILRGSAEAIPLKIGNFYDNAIMENVELEVQGFLSQYISIRQVIDPEKLVHVETKNIVLRQQGEFAMFDFEGVGEHSIVLDKVELGSVTITVSSTPAQVQLSAGQTVNLDLTEDGKNDTAVTLWRVRKGVPDLRVHRLGPQDPNKIYFLEERDYELNISIPKYLQREEMNLTIKITGNLVAINSTVAGFVEKPFTEYRVLLLKILEVTGKEVNVSLDESKRDVQDMLNAGFPATRAQELLKQAIQALDERKFELAVELAERISNIRKASFEADALIKEVERGIGEAKSRLLEVPETERTVLLAAKAFEREDFDTALQRAKDAQLLLVLETKGKINILWFLSTYRWAILIGILVAGLTTFVTYRSLKVSIINQRLKNLTREEDAIQSLIKEAQFKHFKEGTMSAETYKHLVAQYETRMNKIKHLRVELRIKRVAVAKKEKEVTILEKEEKEILGLMKEAQEDYLVRGKLSKQKFGEIYEADRARLAEIEGEREALEERMRRKKFPPMGKKGETALTDDEDD